MPTSWFVVAQRVHLPQAVEAEAQAQPERQQRARHSVGIPNPRWSRATTAVALSDDWPDEREDVHSPGLVQQQAEQEALPALALA
jgi:hypothetical protein